MSRVPKREGVRQNMRKDRLTEFGELLGERMVARKMIKPSLVKFRAGKHGDAERSSGARLAKVWEERDADLAEANASLEDALGGIE